MLHVGGGRGALATALPVGHPAEQPTGRRITLGVHADDADLRYDPQLPMPAGPRVRGTVEMIEPDFGGRQQSVFMQRGGTGLHPGHGPRAPAGTWGGTIEAVLPEHRLYFFDTDTGRAPAVRSVGAACGRPTRACPTVGATCGRPARSVSDGRGYLRSPSFSAYPTVGAQRGRPARAIRESNIHDAVR